jgi:hypothetical protein
MHRRDTRLHQARSQPNHDSELFDTHRCRVACSCSTTHFYARLRRHEAAYRSSTPACSK